MQEKTQFHLPIYTNYFNCLISKHHRLLYDTRNRLLFSECKAVKLDAGYKETVIVCVFPVVSPLETLKKKSTSSNTLSKRTTIKDVRRHSLATISDSETSQTGTSVTPEGRVTFDLGEK